MLSKLVLALSSLLFIVFGSAYVSQAFGPARGGYDALDYVRIAEAIDTGEPYDHRQFPIGYPLVLVAFRRAGFSGNMPLVVFNLICLAIGLAATFTMGRRYLGLSSLELACLGTWIVASRVMLDLATIGQPEMAFLMTTSLAVWCLWRAADGGEVRGTWLAAGVALSVASISLRNVGVALIPAVLWTAVAVSREWHMLRRVLLVITVAAALGAASLWLINFFALFRDSASPVAQPPRVVYQGTGYVRGVLETLDMRWEEASEIIANVGYSAGWPADVRPAGFCLGLLFIATATLGIWTRRRTPAAVYLAAYFSVLSVWPFPMQRFWVPVLPLVICFAWVGCTTFAARFQWPAASRQVIVTAYCALYVAFGLFGLSLH